MMCEGGYAGMMILKCFGMGEMTCDMTGKPYAEFGMCVAFMGQFPEAAHAAMKDKAMAMLAAMDPAPEEEEEEEEKEEKGPPSCAEFAAVCDAAFPEGTWSAEGCMEAFKSMGKESEDCKAYCAPSPEMGGMAKVQALCPMGFKAALMAMEVPEAYIEECD